MVSQRKVRVEDNHSDEGLMQLLHSPTNMQYGQATLEDPEPEVLPSPMVLIKRRVTKSVMLQEEIFDRLILTDL
jgi:hypothetical protein